MWPEDVVKHAQDAIHAASSHSHPDWHIIAPIPTRRMILRYIAEAYPVRPLTGDDFEFSLGVPINRPMRWFRVRFDDEPNYVSLPDTQ